MDIFARVFYNVLMEDVTSASLGGNAATLDLPATDDYAEGDHRVPHVLGGKKGVQRRPDIANYSGHVKTKTKRKRIRKKDS